jgi:hypothetical protein
MKMMNKRSEVLAPGQLVYSVRGLVAMEAGAAKLIQFGLPKRGPQISSELSPEALATLSVNASGTALAIDIE